MSDWSNAIGARLHGGDALFDGVFSDSREPLDGGIFVALRGPRFDGHAHVASAVEAGAVGAMVEVEQPVSIPQWVVPDTRRALGDLGRAWRHAWNGRLGALTGSNGKTTVKEMVAAILEPRGPLVATRGNLNNDLGVPLTLLQLRPEHQLAVVEMGANHPGEIAVLAAMAEPEVGLVTNAGPAHLEGFGDIPGVARAKGELFAGLAAGGTAVINNDDVYRDQWRATAEGRAVLTFGREAGADVRVHPLDGEAGPDGQLLMVETPWGRGETRLPLPGPHNVMNAAAAAAMALAMGATVDEVCGGLARAPGVAGRLHNEVGCHGGRVIDDSYNANPGSLAAAIAVLAEAPGRRILVLGDMGELGEAAGEWHRRAGSMADAAGIDALFTIGPLAAEAIETFGPQGRAFTSVEELVDALVATMDNTTTVLLKGSRAAGLDRVVAKLTSAGEAH
ncbi:MAG: UDP-N-acetylmuramoyl-tripeptide--D-alanyl-D-alanine ligase [Thiohalospira sp.]